VFTSISIKNFRCFRELSVEPLDQVNLIAGKNNVGKTALLEAIFLLIGAENIGLVTKLSTFRGIERFGGGLTAVRETLWGPLFFGYDGNATILISGALNAGEQQSVELKLVAGDSVRLDIDDESISETGLGTNGLPSQVMQLQYTGPSGKTQPIYMLIDEKAPPRATPPPAPAPFPGYFLAARHRQSPKEVAEHFGQLEMRLEPDTLLESLKIIEPRLQRLTTISSAGIPMVYGDIGLGRMIPLPLMGEGVGRLSSILLAIANAPGGVVLVDEVENGLHHTILTRVWQAIKEAAHRSNTQIFATTHSWECIQAAHQAFEIGESYDFRLHRLDWINDTIRAVTYDQHMLATAIATDLEVR